MTSLSVLGPCSPRGQKETPGPRAEGDEALLALRAAAAERAGQGTGHRGSGCSAFTTLTPAGRTSASALRAGEGAGSVPHALGGGKTGGIAGARAAQCKTTAAFTASDVGPGQGQTQPRLRTPHPGSLNTAESTKDLVFIWDAAPFLEQN